MQAGTKRMTGTYDRTETVLTPQEAEAVLELWARRQAEGELRSRLNVQDLAEATGLSTAEVEQMVASIRSGRTTPAVTPPRKRAKPVNYFLIGTAVVIWIAILAWVGLGAYQSGRNSAIMQVPGVAVPGIAPVAPPPDIVIEGIPAPALADVNAAELLPAKSAVEFQGYKVVGSADPIRQLTESDIFSALTMVTSSLEREQALPYGPEQNSIDIIKALQANEAGLVAGEIRFEKMVVSAHGQSKELLIPFATVGNHSIIQPVQQERSKRLLILANWLVNVDPSVAK
jgi:hypothetical protein